MKSVMLIIAASMMVISACSYAKDKPVSQQQEDKQVAEETNPKQWEKLQKEVDKPKQEKGPFQETQVESGDGDNPPEMENFDDSPFDTN